MPETTTPNASTRIDICIATGNRLEMQRSLLASLSRMPVREDWALRIIALDNDAAGSARSSVEAFARQSGIPVTCVLKPQKGVSRARNRAIRNTLFHGRHAHTAEAIWRSADDQVVDARVGSGG